MKKDEGDPNAAEAEGQPFAELALAALLVQAGVESQAQAKEGPQILEEAGKRRGVDVDPFRSLTPFLGFRESPQEVHTHCLEQQVKSNGKTEQEEGDEKILLKTCIINALDVAKGFSNSNT